MGAMGREISPGARLKEHLTLVRALGRGAMGQVWLAEDRRLGQRVAVKFLAFGRERDPSWVARFEREFATAAAIDSPHVVRMFDHDWTAEGIPYIVMERLVGDSLEDCLERGDRFTFEQIATVIRQAGDALDAAHASGVIHRDFKPDNVILVGGPDEIYLKLLDFGLAKAWSRHTLTATGVALGTPDYMSPEQALGAKDVDYRADLWSLAVVVYRMLCGRFPFRAANVQALMLVICRGLYKPPSVVGGPSAFDPFFTRAFQPKRANRFHSAEEMLAEFERIVATGPRVGDEDTDTAIFRPPIGGMGRLEASFDDSAVTRLVTKGDAPAAQSYDSATDTKPILLKTGRAALARDADSADYPEEPPVDSSATVADAAPPVDDDDLTRRMAGRDDPSFPEPAPSLPARDEPSLPVPPPTPSHPSRDDPSFPAPEPSRRRLAAPAGPTARRRRPTKLIAVGLGLVLGAVIVLGLRRLARDDGTRARPGPPADAPMTATASAAPSASAPSPTVPASQAAPDSSIAADADTPADPVDAGDVPADSAFLTIRCRPGCQVWLGRESLGQSPVVDKPLPPGKHRVVVYRSPVGSKVLKIDLEPGERASYEVTMRHPAPRTPPTVNDDPPTGSSAETPAPKTSL